MALLVAIVLAGLVFTNWGEIQHAPFAAAEPPSQGSLAYHCGVLTTGPLCFGLGAWIAPFDGARTSVTVRADSPGDGCVAAGEFLQVGSLALIEAGYRVCQQRGYAFWFWDVSHSRGGRAEQSGTQYMLRSDLGWPATIDIHRVGPQAFAVPIVAQSGTVLTGTANGFALNPTQISIGTNLVGSHGAHQVATTFADNQYRAAGQRSWTYQTRDPFSVEQPAGGPVHPRWQSPPPGSQLGGVLVTCVGETC